MRINPTITVAALGIGAVLTLAACGSNGTAGAAPTKVQLLAAPTGSGANTPTISVEGHGTKSGKPDTATVTLGVQTSDASASTALSKNNAEANALIAALKAKGVADADMQTSDLSISPNWDSHGQITGYSVSNTVTVTLHDLTSAGAIIDDAAAKVGDDVRFDGVALSIAKTNKLMEAARAEAVQDAITQARQLAEAAGVKLGAIRTIDDTAGTTPQPLYFSDKAALAQGSSAAPTPIEAGSQQLSFDVNVVFDISQ